MNTRGQLSDMAVMIIFGFVIGIVFLIVWYVLGIWNGIVADSDLIPQTAKDTNDQAFGNFGEVLDNTFLMVYIGILLAGLVLSYVLRSNPGMFFALLLIVFLFSIVAGYLGNAYTEFANDIAMEGASASFPILGFIMEHYLLCTLVNTTLMIIVFFAKPNEGGGYA